MKHLLLALLLIGASSLPGRSAETLYNGIVLPDVWPPQRSAAELRRGEVMPVPYLKSPPSVIPIDLGRQLFVDDFLVEQTSLRRVFHTPQPWEKNPMLKPEQPWEVLNDNWGLPQTAMNFSDGVWWDPRDRIFKMWYLSGQHAFTSYATSRDGLHWERPHLDVVPRTNIVHHSPHRDSNTVWLDHDARDPAQRFKMYLYYRPNSSGAVFTSPDGIHWSPPHWTGFAGDRTTMFYNPFRKKWVFSLRTRTNAGPTEYYKPPFVQSGRARRYVEADDFIAGARWRDFEHGEEWKPGEPVYWVASDRLDNAAVPPGGLVGELYNLDATPYESLMLGLFSVLSENRVPGRPKINQLYFGFSRDGFHWDRPHRKPAIPVAEKATAWNAGNIQSVGGGCVIVGDRLFFYHSGRSEAYERPSGEAVPRFGSKTGHIRSGERVQQTGVAFLRRDGFASMDGTGTLTTRPLRFQGRHLFVNAAATKGGLKAEIIDAKGRAIPPFTVDNSAEISADSTKAAMTWKGARDLAAVAGQDVRVRFHLRSGALYSFWISPDANGASHGYVAAGGPGFTGPTDTTGK